MPPSPDLTHEEGGNPPSHIPPISTSILAPSVLDLSASILVPLALETPLQMSGYWPETFPQTKIYHTTGPRNR